MTVTTALYRRYRPDSFADVIGQEHVTGPLMTALRKNRVNHAYLFSGPRGCGKTTSARILARCLNCAEGPTDTPCGKCPSCVELARGGSGSLDVIEIDAASHGGVDDARDLRERATYAPVRDRYKIFIIDEAHMVTSAGFNALLKIVEEPPEHIKFIFATTEPDKVIGTIRSRTHHYPFRLVPPEPLMAYLELLCNQENVPVAPGVLSLVIRAGGGSVRDSLSVLDQLMAGAGANGLDYELAVALLGYTHASLLDDVVEAVAASDAATVFRAVDRVIQTGHDPRRFVEDLLERFRDLIIVQAMPESAQSILRGMPADQIARLQNQAHNLGAAELSRAADVTNTALTEMTGATSPRLHLELLCARILLPSSEQNERGIAARIDRVERRLNYGGNDVGAPAAAVSAAPAAVPSRPAQAASAPAAPASSPVAAPVAGAPSAATRSAVPAPAPAASPTDGVAPAVPRSEEPTDGMAPGVPRSEEPIRESLTPPRVSTADWPVDEQAAPGRGTSAQPASRSAAPQNQPAPAQSAPAPSAPAQSAPAQPPARVEPPAPATAERAPAPSAALAPASPGPAPAGGSGGDVEVLRRAWPDILQTLSKIKRSTWALVEPNAQVGQFDGQVLTLAFTTSGLAGAFGRADHSENLRQAIHKTVGIDCQINAVSGGASSSASSEPNPKVPASPETPATPADVAWGLAPNTSGTVAASGVPAASVAPADSAGRPVTEDAADPSTGSANTAHPQAAVRPTPASMDAASKPADSGPVQAVPAQQAPSPTPAPTPAQQPPADNSGSYSYPDDDWGPPLDEDAPPLDEEPPMDWTPSAPVPSRPARANEVQANEVGATAAQASTGQPGAARTSTVQTSAVQPSPAPARVPGGQDATPSGDGSTSPGTAGTHNDPWSRAMEQAPGVWTVGAESNVGKSVGSPDDAGKPDLPEPLTPHYEPASAQVPRSAEPAQDGHPIENGGAPHPVESRQPVGALSGAGSSSTGGWAPSAQYASAPESDPAPAMGGADLRSVAPALAPAALVSQPAQAAPAAPAAAPGATVRQSLYQRLSNSPEAEAGRAKAPARQAETSKTYVQDIPSADDETIEESGVFGRAAVERILGGKLVEERSLDGSPLPPRF
ncbi:DNA polymerase III subunit gamma and tau [Arthrobacter sp. 24S4-2]|uniref:DNA polymerase III subunit gamma and tau n=1 Tax=Arthrobacter sp. 24S4-2 TaxID=2575374 RepID=UPI0010C7A2C8|nr:DNA polymerase III subunit gamma and tau [Arthrobacter sp. 24S4-2]QCO96903.1 DNA polymerase III subunit gamma and tau [Arthrobacter sp. 24S4-2]